MLKKLLASILLAVFLLTSIFVPIAKAQQSTWYNQTFEEWTTKVYDTNTSPENEIFGERYTAAQVQWVIYGLVAFLTSAGQQEIFSCLSEMQSPPDIANCVDSIRNAAEGLMSKGSENSFLAFISSSPVSGIGYVRNVMGRLNLVKDVQAQQEGFGFRAATPVLTLWRVVRNITYSLLVLVTIVLAFMIMFRVKISPQTIISVQTALPKIVIAAILITFSYAIAGFLIDLMYVVIGLVAAIISGSGLVASPYNEWGPMFEALTQRNIFMTMGLFWLWFMTALWVALFSSGLLGAITAVLSFFIYPILMLILAIILLIAWFRIFWLLLRTFVNILLAIIFGPVQILLGAINMGGIGGWIKGLVANLVVYPTVGFLLFLSFLFLRGAFWQYEEIPVVGGLFSGVLDALMPYSVTQAFAGGGWNPPLTTGANQTELLWLGASLVTILLIPRVADIIKGMVDRRPLSYGAAVGEAMGPAKGLAGLGVAAGAGYVGERLTRPGSKFAGGVKEKVVTEISKAVAARTSRW
jgi:hypothetical protein